MGIILKPFAMLLLLFYNLFNSYGIALILFAIVIKMILFPVTLKSKKSMIQTSMLSGRMQQLQKQYGKDRDRYNMEVQKLYEKEHINPMGGCLWSLIPMILLIAVYGIVRQPLTYFMDLSVEQIQLIARQLDWQSVAVANGWVSEKVMSGLVEDLSSGKVTSVFQNTGFNQIYLISLITNENLSSLQAALGEAGKNLFVVNFSFLGMNLNNIPNWKVWTDLSWNGIGLFVMAVLSAVISFLSMKVSLATNQMNQNQPSNAQMDSTNRTMMIVMPLMSLWIGFSFPAALCVYWIAQYLVTMVQEVVCGQLLKKDYEAARAAAEKREQEEKEEEKRRKEEARLERQRRLEEEKANKGKKKKGQKKDAEPDQEGINKEDSREGIRAYARGRAYIPGRFGGVTPYADPDELDRAAKQAVRDSWDTRKEKDKKKAKKEKEEAAREKEEQAAIPAPAEEQPPVTEEPAAPETAAEQSRDTEEGKEED